jgi:hypothetical protein
LLVATFCERAPAWQDWVSFSGRMQIIVSLAHSSQLFGKMTYWAHHKIWAKIRASGPNHL